MDQPLKYGEFSIFREGNGVERLMRKKMAGGFHCEGDQENFSLSNCVANVEITI